MLLYTVGHSDRSLDELSGLLEDLGVDQLADVRRFPRSQTHPQFNREPMADDLADRGIDYRWFEALGGYRDELLPAEESPNTGWDADGFRHYADRCLEEPEWQAALDELLTWAEDGATAYMCAELGWWRCHRRIVSDWLVAKGHEVQHIVDGERVAGHELPDWGEVEDGVVRYPG